MRKNVIVVGVPRSGTSMASCIFASQGYFVAEEPEKDLRQGDEYNPAGYWEAEALIEANVDLFKAVGYPHHNTWCFEPITDEQAGRIGAVPAMERHRELVERYNAHTPWLWKDPRLCYTLGYWWPLMNPETTAVLLLTRNSDHVFHSFLRVGWRTHEADREEVAQRLAAHRAAAERAIRQLNIPHITLAYEDFAARPAETAQKIADFFGLEIGEQDLKFDGLLNHGSPRGKMVVRLEKLVARLPASWRAIIKKLTPSRILDRFFPGRTT